MMRFILYRRLSLSGWQWRWQLKAGNGEIIASGEGYRDKADARHAIKLVQGSRVAAIEERK